MFKVNNKDTTTTPLASFWCLYLFTLNIVSIVNFKQVNADLKEIRGMKRVMRQQLLKNYDKPD